MKSLYQHFALLLLAVFTVTIVPFNALHHHAEDEHVAFMHNRKVYEKHHCELDNHFCQSDLSVDCGHESHLQAEVEKCFSCEFHFIQSFVAAMPIKLSIQETGSGIIRLFIAGALHQVSVLQNNKGPPWLG